jgi:2,5-diamino-6-(ribosylamino)-4(3H)-pyrimidinone 5'-phosphate reductase
VALPVATLFMLMSVDGKISAGASDERDFDRDRPSVLGVTEGLGQYYQLEQTMDAYSLNTGRVLARVGWSRFRRDIDRLPVAFVVVDSQHLTERGVRNLLLRTQRLIVVTTNPQHPATTIQDPRLHVVEANGQVNFRQVFNELGALGVRNLTVQSGGRLNATLVRAGLVHYLSIVLAPVLVGGDSTPTLVDGDPLNGDGDLALLRTLKLLEARPLDAL